MAGAAAAGAAAASSFATAAAGVLAAASFWPAGTTGAAPLLLDAHSREAREEANTPTSSTSANTPTIALKRTRPSSMGLEMKLGSTSPPSIRGSLTNFFFTTLNSGCVQLQMSTQGPGSRKEA